MVEENLHPCPLCGRDSAVGDEPMEGELPEAISQVICPECGQYTILSRMVHGGDHGETTVKRENLDYQEIHALNYSVIADDQTMLWVDDVSVRDVWDGALRAQAHKLGGKAAYAVRVLPYKH